MQTALVDSYACFVQGEIITLVACETTTTAGGWSGS